MDGLEFRSPPKRIVLGNLNQNGDSPVSPMANLKLLTKVATSHFSLGENTEFNEKQLDIHDPNGNLKPSRRLRSLSFICKKFLQIYNLDIPCGDSQQISLVNLAMTLGIEKRRVYDIINVVSSLHMAVKVCKDKYNWFGKQNLPRLLSQLKAYALINKYDVQINAALQNQVAYSATGRDCRSPQIKLTKGIFEENRIGVLCQKFIMLFLACAQDVPLNMCTISKLIISGDPQDKTGMRRLYDIANVLEALDLIKRCQCKVLKKPSFIFCGPEINIDLADYERLMLKELPYSCSYLNQIYEISEHGDTNSADSSSEYSSTTKANSMLEIVCTEFGGGVVNNNYQSTSTISPLVVKKRKLDNTNQCNAKKQLFPYLLQTDNTSTNTFIKAPKHSFRFEFNELQLKELPENNNTTNNQQVIPEIESNCNNIVKNTIPFSANFDHLGRLEDNNYTNINYTTIYNNNNELQCHNETINLNNNYTNDVINITTPNSVITSNLQDDKPLVINKIPNTNQSVQATKIKVLRPMKISDIQNGGVYKVLKKGNTVQLYAL